MKARSAIMLAGHAADAIVWLDDASGSWATSNAFAKEPVAAVKDFVEKNPYEKDLGRVWSLSGAPDSYVNRDAGVGERPLAGWNGLFPHPINGRGGLDAQFFATMKDGAYFINIGRGESVVTADLTAALQAGTVGGAGLDVTDPEPLPPGHPLWGMSNVVITPHIATSSDYRSDRTFTLVAENVRRYVRGDAVLSVVDLAAGY